MPPFRCSWLPLDKATNPPPYNSAIAPRARHPLHFILSQIPSALSPNATPRQLRTQPPQQIAQKSGITADISGTIPAKILTPNGFFKNCNRRIDSKKVATAYSTNLILVQESGPLPSPDTGPDKVLLEVRDFSLRFRGAPSDQINHVNFTVHPGKTLCVVGESGCGKSVTSLAMMGLLPAGAATIRSGEMVFEGQKLDLADHTAMRKLRGSRMTMIFQEPMTSLNPAFRIGDQITEAVLAHSDASKSEAEDKALAILKRVGIPAAEKRMRDYPHQLSGGMRQRVMIAMALVNDPALLIADEPTTALDVTIQAQILELIRDLQAETDMGTIMITHDLGVVAEIADTVAVMYAGTIVETGPAERIFNDPQHPYTIGLMSSIPQLSGPRGRLATVPGMVPTTQNMPQGCRFATRCPFAQPICAQEPPLAPLEGGHAVACHFAPLETHLEQSA